MSGQIPEWLLATAVAVTVFTAVFSAGLSIALDELRWILIARAFELPWPADTAHSRRACRFAPW